jgi:hypothetical protein
LNLTLTRPQVKRSSNNTEAWKETKKNNDDGPNKAKKGERPSNNTHTKVMGYGLGLLGKV